MINLGEAQLTITQEALQQIIQHYLVTQLLQVNCTVTDIDVNLDYDKNIDEIVVYFKQEDGVTIQV
jgi:hypothetical protein